MNFTSSFPSIQPESEQTTNQQQRETSLVAYRGRRVTFVPSQIDHLESRAISFRDKLFLNLGRIFEVNVNELLSIFPQSKRVFELADQTFRQFEQEDREDDDPSLLVFQEKIRNMFHQLGVQRKQQLQLAGVSSGEGLKKKQEEIAGYRALAEERYLRDRENIERRQKIDRYIVREYKGKLSTRDAKIIEGYWNSIAADPKGRIKMYEVEGRLMKLFFHSVDEKMESMLEEFKKQTLGGHSIKFCPFIVNYMKGMAREITQKLIEERRQCQDQQKQLMLDYLLLTGDYQMIPMINSELRTLFSERLKESEKEYEELFKWRRSFNQEYSIKSLEENLKLFLQYVKEAKKNLKSLENENLEDRENLSFENIGKRAQWKSEQSRLKRYGRAALRTFALMQKVPQKPAHLEELRNKTEEEFKQEAYACMVETPEEIAALIPKESDFEQLMVKILDIDTDQQASRLLERKTSSLSMLTQSAEMGIDFKKLSDSIDYFYQQMKERDLQKLKLLKADIEELG